jgi:hypothetical protein
MRPGLSMISLERASCPSIHSTQSKSAGRCRNGAEKLLGVLITIGQAVAYVVAGMYGELSELGVGNALLIILQVCSSLETNWLDIFLPWQRRVLYPGRKWLYKAE